MAKGLRASTKKSNRSKLRARVFGPVEDARTERLHAKLLELVQQPKPEQPAKKEMDIDSAEESKDASKEADFPKEMEVDDGAAASNRATSSSRAPKRKINKSKLKKYVKPRNQMSFAKKKQQRVSKPASGERVRRRRLP